MPPPDTQPRQNRCPAPTVDSPKWPAMFDTQSYNLQSLEAKLNLRCAQEPLNEILNAECIAGPLFRKRQLELSSCIQAWCGLSQTREASLTARVRSIQPTEPNSTAVGLETKSSR